MHPELMEALLEAGDRDVDLLNEGGGVLCLREPYWDLEEPAQLLALFEGKLGTADAPICGVMVLPPINNGEPPPRVPLSALEYAKWRLVLECYDESRDKS